MIDPHKICYIFDVDGTLTEPRQKMSKKNEKRFKQWSKGKQCFIATGSDFEKVKQQINFSTLSSFRLVFCCMGNEIRSTDGTIIKKSNFFVPDELSLDLANFLDKSKFPRRVGNHFEVRTGMLNFSIVGRNADAKEREEYLKWDNTHLERKKIASFINKKYSNLEASVGGSISIDVIERGSDKGQVITYLQTAGAKKVVFVGDRCFPGGNDYGIVRELNKSKVAFEWYNISDPKETFRLIKENGVFKSRFTKEKVDAKISQAKQKKN